MDLVLGSAFLDAAKTYKKLICNFTEICDSMRAVEFKAKLKNNRIQIPKKLHKQVNKSKNKDVRVIVLMDEQNQKEDFQLLSTEQFLKGYAKSDSVYDHY